MAAKHIGDYQPSQALKCLMQQPPPPSTVETREKYMRHVIRYADSQVVKEINGKIQRRWAEADPWQRRRMVNDFRAALADPIDPNSQLHGLFRRWINEGLPRATGPNPINQAHIYGNPEAPPELAVPPTYRPIPERTDYPKEEPVKDLGFWEKLIREQPRRSSGGPTGWRFSLLKLRLKTSAEILQELWIDFVSGTWTPEVRQLMR